MRETKSIEFKAEVIHTFLKAVSAYSNYGTGTITLESMMMDLLKELITQKINAWTLKI